MRILILVLILLGFTLQGTPLSDQYNYCTYDEAANFINQEKQKHNVSYIQCGFCANPIWCDQNLIWLDGKKSLTHAKCEMQMRESAYEGVNKIVEFIKNAEENTETGYLQCGFCAKPMTVSQASSLMWLGPDQKELTHIKCEMKAKEFAQQDRENIPLIDEKSEMQAFIDQQKTGVKCSFCAYPIFSTADGVDWSTNGIQEPKPALIHIRCKRKAEKGKKITHHFLRTHNMRY